MPGHERAYSSANEVSLEDLPRYKSDQLLLLVGSNPLPNAVAACLLLNDSGAAHLLHSPGTAGIARHLQTWLSGHKRSSVLIDTAVDASDPLAVVGATEAWLDTLPADGSKGSVGLHYTGGTKVMSVHSRRTLREALRGRLICSYLHAQSLSLR